jgi:hypothetical protein
VEEAPAAPTAPPAPTIDLSQPLPGGSLHGTPRPPLENTGDDYVAITQSLIANLRWISENPDPALIADVFVPGTPGHDQRVTAYQYLVANGYRWADDGYQLIGADVVSVDDRAVSVRVTDEMAFERVVNKEGEQVGQVRPRTPTVKTWVALLAADDSGAWRFADASFVDEPTVEL